MPSPAPAHLVALPLERGPDESRAVHTCATRWESVLRLSQELTCDEILREQNPHMADPDNAHAAFDESNLMTWAVHGLRTTRVHADGSSGWNTALPYLQRLHEAGANPAARDANGWSMLWSAVDCADVDVVFWLLDLPGSPVQLDPNEVSTGGQSLAHIAPEGFLDYVRTHRSQAQLETVVPEPASAARSRNRL